MLIAQISDFHIKPEGALAYDAADTTAALGTVVAHINRMKPLPDVIIVSGDVADGGSLESYTIVRDLLSSLKPPFYMVPGNHDQKDNMAATFPEHTYLSERIQGNNGAYICYAVEDFPIRLIGLDTVTPGQHGGGLGPRRLDWISRKLMERPSVPTLIFMHHPPFASAISPMDLMPFVQRHEFRELIEMHPQVERVTCGHIHRSISRRFAKTIATVCPGVGMQLLLNFRPDAPPAFVLEPPAVLLHHWDNSWDDDPTLLTHVSIVEDFPNQYGGSHLFFEIISPE